MVVIRPFSIPMPSFSSTWTTGARQLVVQEALDTTLWFALSYSEWFTPTTKVFKSPFPGAEMMTFLAPASMCPAAFSASTKRPVDSITYSTPMSFQGKALGPSRLAWMHLILWPFTISSSFSPIFTSCLKRPCTVSYFIWYAKYSASVDISTTPTTSSLLPKRFWSQMAWKTMRPMRPNPLMPIFVAMTANDVRRAQNFDQV
mmetsp:Transcript_24278/g.50345  ORF Transcript_24278/g.50345 Transcript_24278/m.50345 type:complete len:202 (-) Transcript_24278:26-631(-)